MLKLFKVSIIGTFILPHGRTDYDYYSYSVVATNENEAKAKAYDAMKRDRGVDYSSCKYDVQEEPVWGELVA